MIEPLGQVAAPSSVCAEGWTLGRNFAWTLAGSALYATCQWGILISIAKLGTPAMVGQFALGLAVSAPVFMLTSLQLRAVLATDARDEYRLAHYFALRILGTAAGLILIVGFLAVSHFQRDTAIVILLVSLAKAAETLSDIIYGFWQKHEHFDKIAIALSGRGLGSLAAMAAVLYFTRSIALATAAMALYWTLWLAVYERKTAKTMLASISPQEWLRAEWDFSALKRLAFLVLPLGFVAVLASLNFNIPRYFIEHYWGERALGYFAAAAYLQMAGNTLVIALGQSAVPRLARDYHLSRTAFRLLVQQMILIVACIGVGGVLVAVLFGRPLLELLYRPDYAQYNSVFVWLMLAGALNFIVSVLCVAMTASRMFRPQAGLFVITTLSIIAGSWFFVPRFGLEGAAYAVLAGSIVSCLGAICLTVRSAIVRN